jgi:hypothetical protein
VAKDVASDRKHIFVALVGGVAAALALGAFILFRKSRSTAPTNLTADPRRGTSSPASVASPSGPAPSVPQSPPGFGPGSTQVVPPEELESVRGKMAAGPPGGGFGGGMTIAVPGPGEGPRFGGMTIEASGPPGAAPLRPSPPPNPRTLCPVCGTEYGPESRFCGKDGATLVPMN